ncbi:MAG: hypothetical protein PHY51_05490 [Candidatus Gracilibacteria bacterium]|nr:hypothetical protein [Candidatus Gracilibacteria bacterium]
MKKVIILLIVLISSLNIGTIFASTGSSCGTDTNGELTDMLNGCQPDNVLGSANKTSVYKSKRISVTKSSNGGYEIKDFKAKLLFITTNLVILASILAIGGIVYAGVLFTTAYGDDGKIKKAKDAIKWSLIGFLVAIISQQLINAIINLIYGISG